MRGVSAGACPEPELCPPLKLASATGPTPALTGAVETILRIRSPPDATCAAAGVSGPAPAGSGAEYPAQGGRAPDWGPSDAVSDAAA